MTEDRQKFEDGHDMDSESKQGTKRMYEDVLQLDSAVLTRNLKLLKELLAGCDTPEVFKAYLEYTSMPIVYYAIIFWYRQSSRNPSSEFFSDNEAAILEELNNAGADINEPTYANYFVTPIILAVKLKNLRLCKVLAALGADLRSSYRELYRERYEGMNTKIYESLLSVATDNGPVFVSFLLENNIEPTEHDDQLGDSSPLSKALVHHKTDVLELFMDRYLEMNRPFPWESAIDRAILAKRENHLVAILQRRYHLGHINHSSLQEMYFKRSLCRKLKTVMRVLIEQEPHIVHKSWMLEISLPDELNSSRHNDFLVWLQSLQSQPFALQVICRYSILRQLGPKPEAFINQLPLPVILKDYLKEEYVL